MKEIIFALLLFGFVFAVANPSATYCSELGYTYGSVQDSEGGEVGMCTLPNGQSVDAWDFYRGTVATQYSYCVQNGYGIKSITEDMGGWTAQYAACVLPNGTEVPVDQLMGIDSTASETPLDTYTGEGTPSGTEQPLPSLTPCSPTVEDSCPEGEYCDNGVCNTIPSHTTPGTAPELTYGEEGGVNGTTTPDESGVHVACNADVDCAEGEYCYAGYCEEEPAQLPNPASAYCTEHGGTLSIKKDGEGNEYGECTLSDGTVCEEWAYFRGECPKAEPVAPTEPSTPPAEPSAPSQPAEPTEEEGGSFLWIEILLVLVIVVLAYWFFVKK